MLDVGALWMCSPGTKSSVSVLHPQASFPFRESSSIELGSLPVVSELALFLCSPPLKPHIPAFLHLGLRESGSLEGPGWGRSVSLPLPTACVCLLPQPIGAAEACPAAARAATAAAPAAPGLPAAEPGNALPSHAAAACGSVGRARVGGWAGTVRSGGRPRLDPCGLEGIRLLSGSGRCGRGAHTLEGGEPPVPEHFQSQPQGSSRGAAGSVAEQVGTLSTRAAPFGFGEGFLWRKGVLPFKKEGIEKTENIIIFLERNTRNPIQLVTYSGQMGTGVGAGFLKVNVDIVWCLEHDNALPVQSKNK